MPSAHKTPLLIISSLGGLLFALPASAVPAAHVEFAIGNVSAVNGAGVSRPLAKGAEVDAGDTIDTGEGRAQLRFSDGAYISLQPGSQFRIDEYNYAGKADDTERGFFSLIKGGLRTITGLIGRSNRRNYQVRVPVATIGIRGTEYTLRFDGAASGSVGEGTIVVCNGGGCLDVTSGQSYIVSGPDAKPVLSAVRTSLPPPPPSTTTPEFIANDTVTTVVQDGKIIAAPASFPDLVSNDLLFGDQIPTPGGPQLGGPRPRVTTQPVVLALTINQFPAALNIGETTDVRATTADVEGGRLVSWIDPVAINTIGTASVADRGNRGLIAWGRFTNGTIGSGDPSYPTAYANVALTDANSLHYVVAKVTPVANLPTTGTLTFSTIAGATTPTSSAGGFAHLDSALAVAQFNATLVSLGTLNATVNLTLSDGKQVNFNGVGNIPTGSATFGNLARSVTGTGCVSCSGDFYGMFAGPNAQYAGFTYGMDGTTSGSVRGAVVLRR